MSSTDEMATHADPNSVPFLNTALKYGLIGGALMTVWTLLAAVVGLSEPTTMNGIIGLVVMIVIFSWTAYTAISTQKNDVQGGFISMGRGFMTGFVALIITGLIAGLAGYIYYNLIDPGAIDGILEATAEMMEGFGLNEEQIEEAINSTRDGFTLFGMVRGGLIYGVVLGGIISAIIAAVQKRKPGMVV